MLISLLCVFPHKCFNSWLKWRYLIFEGRKKPSPLPLTNWSKTEQNQKHNFIIGPWQWELREQTCNIWLSFFQFGQKHFKYSQMFELLNLSSFILPILCPTPSYFSYYWQRMPVPLMCFFFLLKIIPFLHLHSFKKTSQVPFLQWGFPWYICPGPCDHTALFLPCFCGDISPLSSNKYVLSTYNVTGNVIDPGNTRDKVFPFPPWS